MAFNDEPFDKQKKHLETQLKDLDAKKARAAQLWAKHGEPLVHEDRVLLHSLLHDYLHGED